MKKVLRDQVVYKLGTQNAPVLEVECGERIIIETEDCFSNCVRNESSALEECLDFSRVNPASGPIYLHGAEVGQTLKVQIHTIKLAKESAIVALNGLGVLGHLVEQSQTKLLTIQEDHVLFGDLKIPLRPMIGVIGVAPAEGEILNNTPGDHGGNLDTIEMRADSTLYLPIFQTGAYFAVGDLHATMGDGELCGAGAESRGEVELTLDICERYNWSIPVIETDQAFFFLGSAETLDEALEKATIEAVEFLAKENTLTWNEAYMLVSLATDAQISQAVNPLKTVRVRVPKYLLKK